MRSVVEKRICRLTSLLVVVIHVSGALAAEPASNTPSPSIQLFPRDSTRVFSPSTEKQPQRPNVVLIVCDDLNGFITGMEGHPQARTPNIERLASSGISFRRAYSNNPICAPSRSSFLTGIYPHTSKNLFFNKWFENPVLANSKTLMRYFRDNGYRVVGSGKMMHHHVAGEWDEYPYKPDYGPFVFDGKERVAHPSVPMPYRSIGPVDGSFAALSDVPYADDDDKTSGWIYGVWGKTKPFRYVDGENRDPTPDERNARWAADRIEQFANDGDDQPFLLGVGFIRPHTPLHVPERYFKMFPKDQLKLPVIKPGDAEDCHYAEVIDRESKGLKYFRMLQESYPDQASAIKAFLQAYLASIAAVDQCIGEVVTAVDASPFKDNTVIVLTSDHGWNMCEKDYLFKNALWEESTRVPLVIRVPGVAKPGEIAEQPVSLIDLYPTLIDLCGLKGDNRKNEQGAKLDGHSLRPLLEDPKREDWGGPSAALTMVFGGSGSGTDLDKQHWALRTRRWRYILYNNGAEELYDHDTDPNEWNNLAEKPDCAETKMYMKQLLHRMRDGELAGP